MRRHLDRRTRVAVAAALLAPAVLLGGIASASASPANPAVADDDPDSGWWDAKGPFERSAQEPRAEAEDDGPGEGGQASDFDNDDDSEDAVPDDGVSRRPDNREAEEAAQRFANDPGFSNNRAPEKDSAASSEPDEEAGEKPSEEPPQGEPASARDNAGEPSPMEDVRGREDDSAAPEGDEASESEADKFSVETPEKNFDEGMARAQRGRNSDIPKAGETAEKRDAGAKDKAAKPKIKSKAKAKAAKK